MKKLVQLLFVAAVALLFAAAPGFAAETKTVEGESMVLSGSAVNVVSDSQASGGKAATFWTNGTAKASYFGSVESISITMRGQQCSGAPRARVLVDGSGVATIDVKNKHYSTWNFSASASSGEHTIEVRYANDYSSYNCDRNLFLDKLVVVGQAPVEPTPSTSIVDGVLLPDSSASAINAYGDLVGNQPGLVNVGYQWWGNGSMPSASRMDGAKSVGAEPMITWEPWDGTMNCAYDLDAIVAGNHDAYITEYAKQSAAYGKTFYLRFAHEMNMVDNYTWVTGTAPDGRQNACGNMPSDFVAAWKHVHNIFQAQGASNVIWVWSPNIYDPWGAPVDLAELYPGDAYVGWMGMDGYNWGDTVSWSHWKSFSEVFGETYNMITPLSSKPLMIAEFASCESGGDKAAWIRDTFETQIPENFPRINAFLWFQYNKECDWRVNSSVNSLDAFREAISSSY